MCSAANTYCSSLYHDDCVILCHVVSLLWNASVSLRGLVLGELVRSWFDLQQDLQVPSVTWMDTYAHQSHQSVLRRRLQEERRREEEERRRQEEERQRQEEERLERDRREAERLEMERKLTSRLIFQVRNTCSDNSPQHGFYLLSMKFNRVQRLSARNNTFFCRQTSTAHLIVSCTAEPHDTWTAISLLRREESLREMQGQNARQALIDSAFDDLEDACSFAHWNMLECVVDINWHLVTSVDRIDSIVRKCHKDWVLRLHMLEHDMAWHWQDDMRWQVKA